MKLSINRLSGTTTPLLLIVSCLSAIQSFPYPLAAREGSTKEAVTLNTNRHGIRVQPELDKIDIDEYLKNKRAMKLQVGCLIYDGPCDWVGRWLKPRVSSALLGECLMCTEHQKGQLPKIMDFIQDNFPTEFKIGVTKYLALFGIDVPTDAVKPQEEVVPESIISTEEESTDKTSSAEVSKL